MSDDFPKISDTEHLILKLISINGPEMFGLEIVRASNGKVKRGSLYTTLARMESKGLVKSRKETTPPDYLSAPRRMYTLSGLGDEAMKAKETAQVALINGVFA